MFHHPDKIHIERIKNVMIVLLLITTILLLSFFWKDISLDDIGLIRNNQNVNSYVPEAKDLIKPKRILVHFGSDQYTVVQARDTCGKGTYYDAALDLIREYMKNASSSEKIEESQYREVMSYASFSVRFEYNLPLKEYMQQNDIRSSHSFSDIPEMSSIGFSTASSENMFIRDKNTDSYYRIILKDDAKIKEMSEKTSAFVKMVEESGYVPYYNMTNLVGVENDALMPLYMQSNITQISGNREFSFNDQAQLSKVASPFFASGLDFVRKITKKKGSLMYMYGSNQSLIMEEDGSLKYEETLEPALYSQAGFNDSLSTAIDYVSGHGGWNSMFKSGCRPYLAVADKITEKGCSGYHFVFALERNDVAVEYSAGNILSVDVYGSQVTSYCRDILIPISPKQEEDNWYDTKPPIDILTENYEKIGSIIGTDTFEEVTAAVTNIKFCYIRDKKNDSLKIKPVWFVRTEDGSILWFDPVTGEFMGYVSTEAG